MGGYQSVYAEKYVELLVKTSDNIHSAAPRSTWTAEMRAKERRTNGKQGYISRVEPEGFSWGRLELDPKRFAIIRIPSKAFRKKWLEPEYDKTKAIMAGKKVIGYEVKTKRKYRLPLESFLSPAELKDLKAIPYNEKKSRPAIRKTLKKIKNKIKKVNWKKRPKDLILHGSAGTFTIKAIGGDYTHLSSWNSAEACDLTADGEPGICIAECYNDWDAGLSGATTIAGWTTDAGNYIKIYAPVGERHNGKAMENGNYTGFTLKASSKRTSILYNQEDHTRIEGISIDLNDKRFCKGFAWDALTFIDKCIAFNNNASSSSHNRGFSSSLAGDKTRLSNCLAYDIDAYGFWFCRHTEGRVYNCAAINCKTGFYADKRNASLYFKNCLSTGNSGYDFQEKNNAGTINLEYCASEDATADDWGGTANRINQTFSFVDSANDDFHLVGTDTGAQKQGTDLSSDPVFAFGADIDGDARTGIWDIGIDQLPLPAAPHDGPTYYLK